MITHINYSNTYPNMPHHTPAKHTYRVDRKHDPRLKRETQCNHVGLEHGNTQAPPGVPAGMVPPKAQPPSMDGGRIPQRTEAMDIEAGDDTNTGGISNEAAEAEEAKEVGDGTIEVFRCASREPLLAWP